MKEDKKFPSYISTADQHPNEGKKTVVLFLDPDEHRLLKLKARAIGISMNAIVSLLAREWMRGGITITMSISTIDAKREE